MAIVFDQNVGTSGFTDEDGDDANGMGMRQKFFGVDISGSFNNLVLYEVVRSDAGYPKTINARITDASSVLLATGSGTLTAADQNVSIDLSSTVSSQDIYVYIGPSYQTNSVIFKGSQANPYTSSTVETWNGSIYVNLATAEDFKLKLTGPDVVAAYPPTLLFMNAG